MTTPSAGASAVSIERHERWRAHVVAQARGTLSQRAYCEANELAYSSFTYWRRRVTDRGHADAHDNAGRVASPATDSAFVPVRVAAPPPSSGSGPALAIVLPSGVRIEGITAAHVATVTALVAAL